MAILRKREELLPVTCAVLADQDRSSLFAALRKRSGNKLDRVAAFCGVPVSLVSDWASGRSNVPYHFLQRLCEQFDVPVPPVGELRRELQVATELPSRPVPPLAKHLAPPPLAPRPEPAAQAPAPAPEPRPAQRPPSAERQDSGRKPRRGRERKPQRAQRPEAPPRDPKFSDLAAYWTAVNLAAGRVAEDAIVLAASDCLGHNYLGTWAVMSRDLFGLQVELTAGEDGTTREARLPTRDIQKFLERAGLKPGALPPGGAPRWVWSNAQWRTAFVRGIVDASAQFERTPALIIARLPEELRRALKKMLSGLKLESKDTPEGGLTLEGEAAVRLYFTSVGADNLRLRDQLKAHFGDVVPGTPDAAPQTQDAGTPATAPGTPGERTGSRRRSRGRRDRGRRGAPETAGTPQAAAAPVSGNPQAGEPMDDPETKVDIGNEALPVHEPSDEQPPAPPTPFMEE